MYPAPFGVDVIDDASFERIVAEGLAYILAQGGLREKLPYSL